MAYGQITASTLNLRTEAKTSSTTIGSFATGTIVEILGTVTGENYSTPTGTNNQWNQVKVSGKDGFMAAFYIAPSSPPGTGSSSTNSTGSPAPGSQKILDAITKVNAGGAYYKARDITGDRKNETFCNFFVADVLDQLGISLPRYDASAGSMMKPHPIYGNNTPFKPYAAEALYTHFKGGGGGKWAAVTSATADKADAQKEAIDLARSGKVVVASFPGSSGGQGHIAIVRPDSSGTNVKIAQAGRVSSNNLALKDGFGNNALSTTKFFTFTG